MKRMFNLEILFALIILGSSASAQNTGKDVLDLCRQPDATQCILFARGVLSGVDYGVTYGALIAAGNDMEKFRKASDAVMSYCFPPESTTADMFIAIHSQLLENEELHDLPAASAIVEAVTRGFPCK